MKHLLLLPLLLTPFDDYLPAARPPQIEEANLGPVVEVKPQKPVVRVDSLKRGCSACDDFKAWEKANGGNFPLRFEIHEWDANNAPADVPSFPHFRFQDANGKWKQPDPNGWHGPEAILEAYKFINPEFGKAPPQAVAAKASDDKTAMQLFSRFVGPGDFKWKPVKPVAGYVNDETWVAYKEINCNVQAAGNAVVVRFNEPRPVVKVKKAFVWLTLEVQSASPEMDGNTVKAVNLDFGWTKYRVKVEEQ